MGLYGQFLLCLATALTGLGGAMVLSGNTNPRNLSVGKRFLFGASGAATAALLVLVFLLLSHDYRISYVRSYADRSMSIGYLLTAVWGGNQGSLLFWAVLQTLFTSAVGLFSFKHIRNLVPVALFWLATLQLFFLGLVLFQSNPFNPLGTIVESGIGMKPLLRNPFMVFHPPTLFLGFVGFFVPLAFGIAALVEGRAKENWLGEIRPFVIFAWVFLGIGNVLGMVWAYEELGWGGYWGWDPVENASFMPWLTGTALVHSAVMLRTRPAFSPWSLILSWLTFVLVVFGTFLTRSGIIQSVHAFSGATTGPYFLALMIGVTVVFFGLFAFRCKGLTSKKAVESWMSKEGFFYLTNIAFVLSAAFVWLATMAPLFTELFRGEKAAVTPEFYNRWMVPFGLAILSLLGLCLMRMEKNQSLAKWVKPALVPALIGVLIALGVVWTRSRGGNMATPVKAAIGSGIIGLVAWFVLRKLKRTIAGGTKVTLRRRLGAHLIHLSVILLFVGFTGAAYTQEMAGNLSPMQSMRVGSYTFTFLRLREDNTFKRHALLADVEVRKDGESLGIMSPSRHTHHSHPNEPTSEVSIRTTLAEDVFLSLNNVDPMTGRAVIKAIINPLVVWIWIGGALMVIGGFVGFLPRGLMNRMQENPRAKRRTLLTGMGLLGIALVGTSAGMIGDELSAATALIGICLASVVYFVGSALMHWVLAGRSR